MDFYSTEKRNKLIQAAMDSYKYKDLPLEIDDFLLFISQFMFIK